MMDCNLSHVLGYLRKKDNLVGYSGVEKYYQDLLKGINGIEYHKVDRFSIDQGIFYSAGNMLRVQGNDLFLTIDSNLQAFSESLMSDYVGSIVVMNSENGEILTLVSKPDFDLSSFSLVKYLEKFGIILIVIAINLLIIEQFKIIILLDLYLN